MGRRTILLVAAILVAALGTVLVWMYANRAEDAALAGQQPVEVLVATSDIPAGTTGAEIAQSGLSELRQLPAASVPPGALSDLTPVASQRITATVFTGQVLIGSMFGSQVQPGGGLSLPRGTMAVSVSLGDPQRVAGFVSPGSQVAVFLTAQNVGGENGAQTVLLLPRVPVVAVGPQTVSSGTSSGGQANNAEQIPSAILTLALTQVQAQRLIQAQATGQLYLGLLDDDSTVSSSARGTTNNNLLD
jgi:pilus assembly protein CpaB